MANAIIDNNRKSSILAEDNSAADTAVRVKATSDGHVLTVGTIQSSSTYAYSVDNSAALEASSVIKASAGTLYKITGRIDSTAATASYYVQALNAASVPADGAVTFLIFPVKVAHTTGTDSYFDIDITDGSGGGGAHGSTGLVWCVSSTEFTKTISGAVASASALYK